MSPLEPHPEPDRAADIAKCLSGEWPDCVGPCDFPCLPLPDHAEDDDDYWTSE